MNTELVLPIVVSIGWLVLAMSALASHRLGWGQAIKMALAWAAIFGGLYLVVAWFMIAQGNASLLM